MIFINGIGFALPETVVSNDFLAALDQGAALVGAASELGISSRRTTLPLSYLEETKNSDIRKALDAADASPTDLGIEAARMALKSAGITEDEIGLIVASGMTPWQTIPSEAARIAQRLGIKLPVYDINGVGAELPFFLHLISSWKESRIPDYVLFVATHTPTQRVSYDRGTAGALFGDAAGALVVSAKMRRGLDVKNTYFTRQPQPGASMSIFEPFRLDLSLLSESAASRTHILLERQAVVGLEGKRSILTQLAPAPVGLIAEQYVGSYSPQSQRNGYSCGASAIVELAQTWSSLEDGAEVVVAEAGLGEGFGVSELKKC